MSAVIQYRTLSFINITSTLILSFVLVNSVALHCVLGIHFLLAMGDVVDLVQGQLKCSELNQEFRLQFDPPDSTNFNASFTTVPDGDPSYVSLLSSFLQHNSSDGTITYVSRHTYSNNLVVTDNYFKGVFLVP